MDQRLVKPIFWPVLLASSFLLAAFMFFLIGGLVVSRNEDLFIAALVGLVLFLAARTVQNNVAETPTLAIFLMFFWPVIALVGMIAMLNNLNAIDFYESFGAARFPLHAALANLQSAPWEIFNFWANLRVFAGYDVPPPAELERAFYLAGGVIAATVFIGVQVVTIVLLFVGTKPEKKVHRH